MPRGGGWRVLPFERASAAAQLAQTEALWRDVATSGAPATLRWYGYDETALVLGVGQSLETVDSTAASLAGVPVVKRTSGGTTVVATLEMIALDIAISSEHMIADVVESYRWVGGALLEALRSVTPDKSPRLALALPHEAKADQAMQREAPSDAAEGRRALACFGVLSPYEVVLTDAGVPARKLIGLSQVRKRGVVLYQAGLYARFAGADLARYMNVPNAARAALARELDRRIASLADAGIDDAEALIGAIERAIAGATPEGAG